MSVAFDGWAALIGGEWEKGNEKRERERERERERSGREWNV